jgi:hypothetical protein
MPSFERSIGFVFSELSRILKCYLCSASELGRSMKILKNNSPAVILFSIIVLLVLFLNIVLGKHPILDLFKYLESGKYYWTIPVTVLFLCGLFLFDRSMRRLIINERVEIFNATIRTLQDILQNSSSSMQLLILDMKDENVHEEIIMKAEKNLAELKKVINAFSLVDPSNIELKKLNRYLSIITIPD